MKKILTFDYALLLHTSSKHFTEFYINDLLKIAVLLLLKASKSNSPMPSPLLLNISGMWVIVDINILAQNLLKTSQSLSSMICGFVLRVVFAQMLVYLSAFWTCSSFTSSAKTQLKQFKHCCLVLSPPSSDNTLLTHQHAFSHLK